MPENNVSNGQNHNLDENGQKFLPRKISVVETPPILTSGEI